MAGAASAGAAPPPLMAAGDWSSVCETYLKRIDDAKAARKALAFEHMNSTVEAMEAFRRNETGDVVKPEGRQTYFGSYFMDTLGTVPPGTDAMKDCQARTRKLDDAIEDVGWSKPEENALLKVVEPVMLELRRKLVDVGTLSADLLEPSYITALERKGNAAGKEGCQQERQREEQLAQRRREERRARAMIAEQVDWAEVLERFEKLWLTRSDRRRRTAPELRRQWEQKLGLVEGWTKAEAAKLTRLAVHKYKERDWEALAEELGSGHSAMQCLRYYHQHCKPDRAAASAWSAHEDQRLAEGIQLHSRNFVLVAEHVGTRTAVQCRYRYNNLFHSQTAKPWSHEEDIRLAFAVRAYAKMQLQDTPANGDEGEERGAEAGQATVRGSKELTRWTDIAKHVPGRTEVHCRVRWQQTLDPDKNRGEWTQEELKKLEEAVASCEKGNWVEVAKKVGGGRDRTACRGAWRSQMSHKQYKQIVHKNRQKRRYKVVSKRSTRHLDLLSADEMRAIVKGQLDDADLSDDSSIDDSRSEEDDYSGQSSSSDSAEMSEEASDEAENSRPRRRQGPRRRYQLSDTSDEEEEEEGLDEHQQQQEEDEDDENQGQGGRRAGAGRGRGRGRGRGAPPRRGRGRGASSSTASTPAAGGRAQRVRQVPVRFQEPSASQQLGDFERPRLNLRRRSALRPGLRTPGVTMTAGLAPIVPVAGAVKRRPARGKGQGRGRGGGGAGAVHQVGEEGDGEDEETEDELDREEAELLHRLQVLRQGKASRSAGKSARGSAGETEEGGGASAAEGGGRGGRSSSRKRVRAFSSDEEEMEEEEKEPR